MTTDNTAITIEMKGDIFSPGFKTLICRFAAEESLGGWIRNGNGGVLVHLEGQPEAIQRFIIHLPGNLYPAFMLKELNIVKKSSPQYTGKSPTGKNFENLTEHHEFFHIKPDYAPCDNCLHEIHDPSSRRYCYPFWGCADCGPSYSALQRMPFVRKNTFLSAFPPCKNCEDERKDAKDSNHHFSELLSCPDCGPQLYFTDNKGVLLEDKNAICVARKSLNNGEIVTLQSIFGGFYMTVDGRSRKGLAALRMRNNIPCKPLGVIAKNMQVIRKYCQVSPEEEKLLQSPACPMVLLHLREDLQDDIISNLLLPDGQRTLGVSLPPTALFHLLFFHHKELDSEQNDIPEDPELLAVIQDNWFRQIPNPQIEILMKHLEPITDKFLCHDLHVGFNCSTSITAVRDGQARLFRRSRGYVPMPVYIKKNARKIIAAFGGDEHAAVALAYGKQIIPSQEIGNLCGANNTQRLTELVDHLSVLYDCVPEAVVCDMNTHLFASQAAAAFAEKRHLPLLTVESHHAQALACMAESGLKRSMALILNESSKGPDSFLWGAEMLNVNLDSFQRMAAFMPVLSPEKNGSDRPALFLAERMMEAGFQLTDAWFKAYHLTHAEKEYLRSQEKIDSVKNHSAGALIK